MYAMAAGSGDIVSRMRATWIAILLAALGGRAIADDRAPVLDVEGALGAIVPHDPMNETPQDQAPIGIARAMVSWELPPVEMPAARGYAWRVGIGPELGVGFIGNDRRGDGFAQAGLRLEVGFAQREMGLFRVSSRGGLWLAARGGLVGGEHSTMLEGDLGWFLWLGHTGWRVGWEIGGLGVKNPTEAGVAMRLYSTQPDGVTEILHVALFVGTAL